MHHIQTRQTINLDVRNVISSVPRHPLDTESNIVLDISITSHGGVHKESGMQMLNNVYIQK